MVMRLGLILSLSFAVWVSQNGIHAHITKLSSLREPKHHHCIHDTKLDEFEETVDKTSLAVPQEFARTARSDNQHSTFLESFLDAVGMASTTRKQRLLEEAVSAAATFQPIRIAFDLSKLTRYRDSSCDGV